MKRHLMPPFLLLAALLSSLLVTWWHIHGAAERFGLKILEQTARELREEIQASLRYDQELLTIIARLIVNADSKLDSPKIRQLLASCKTEGALSWLELLLPDGRLFDKHGELTQLSEQRYRQELARAPYVSEPSLALDGSGKTVVRNIMPVWRGGVTVGLLLGVVDTERLPRLFQATAFGAPCQIHILDDSGNMLMATGGNEFGPSIAIGPRETKKGQDWNKALDDMAANRTGNVVYRSQHSGEYLYLRYEPLGINNWTLLVALPEANLFSTTWDTRTVLLQETAVIIGLCVLFLLWVLWAARNAMRDRSMQIALARQALGLERLLSAAHREPALMREALVQLADSLAAQCTVFLVYKGTARNQIWYSGPPPADADGTPMTELPALPACYTLARREKLVDVRCQDHQLPPQEAMQLRQLGVQRMLLAFVGSPDDELTGLLAAINPPATKENIRRLEVAALSFGTALDNISSQNSLKEKSETDALTGLNNRHSFEACLRALTAQPPTSLGCAYLDANGLRELNNTQGHADGDRMLLALATALQRHLPAESLFRVGGDEFVILLPDCAENGLDASLQAVTADIARQGYSCSIGMAWRTAPCDVDALIKEAEARMYQAKRRHYESAAHDRRQPR